MPPFELHGHFGLPARTLRRTQRFRVSLKVSVIWHLARLSQNGVTEASLATCFDTYTNRLSSARNLNTSLGNKM